MRAFGCAGGHRGVSRHIGDGSLRGAAHGGVEVDSVTMTGLPGSGRPRPRGVPALADDVRGSLVLLGLALGVLTATPLAVWLLARLA